MKREWVYPKTSSVWLGGRTPKASSVWLGGRTSKDQRIEQCSRQVYVVNVFKSENRP